MALIKVWMQVRLVQNKEPDHFFKIFHGGVFVHLGGLNNEDEGKEGPNKERLYQIKGYNEFDTHAVQVRFKNAIRIAKPSRSVRALQVSIPVTVLS